jgi:hypothetical protein
MARQAAHDPEKIEMWKRAVRVQLAVARSLRLTPQSRADPKTIARQEPSVLRKPWKPLQPWEDDK